MKAIALIPGTKKLFLEDRPEPKISAPDDIKMRVLEVGICGTDREEASGGRADAPKGEKELVIGHEMLGEVVEVGSAVTLVKVGDYAVFTVRRGCGQCLPCKMDCADMCLTANYKERGIKELHGFEAQYVVDKEKYLVKVPAEIKNIGVLCEPMSVVEKGIDEVIRIQKARLPDWSKLQTSYKGKKALVVGLGPIGLLGAIALRLRDFDVLGLDIVPSESQRPRILEEIGGQYINGKNTKLDQILSKYGHIDIILEAAGIAQLDFTLLEALGTNGGYVLTGVTAEKRSVTLDGGSLMQALVLKNQMMVGSVNAGKKHWQLAVDDLLEAYKKWKNPVSQLITHRVPVENYQDALLKHEEDEIKCVINWENFK